MVADTGDEVVTRTVVVPLGNAIKGIPRAKRAARAIKEIRKVVARAMKENESAVWIFGDVNEAIWARGRARPPMKIKVFVEEIEEGHIEVTLASGKEEGEASEEAST
jgi:large subunit ribosomal protein L31e